jgi:hypothetical protein
MHGNVPVRFGRGRLDSLGNKGLAAYLMRKSRPAGRFDEVSVEAVFLASRLSRRHRRGRCALPDIAWRNDVRLSRPSSLDRLAGTGSVPAATAYTDGMPDVTQLLHAAAAGDRRAAAELLPLVYLNVRRYF